MKKRQTAAFILQKKWWCPERDLNSHDRFGSRDFKSLASTNSATRAGIYSILRDLYKTRFSIFCQAVFYLFLKKYKCYISISYKITIIYISQKYLNLHHPAPT